MIWDIYYDGVNSPRKKKRMKFLERIYLVIGLIVGLYCSMELTMQDFFYDAEGYCYLEEIAKNYGDGSSGSADFALNHMKVEECWKYKSISKMRFLLDNRGGDILNTPMLTVYTNHDKADVICIRNCCGEKEYIIMSIIRVVIIAILISAVIRSIFMGATMLWAII